MADTSPSPASPAWPDSRAMVGLIISAAGLAGWLIMLAIVFAIPKEPYTEDGQRNLLAGLHNSVAYLFQVSVGLAGLLISGTLSLVGTVTSTTAIGGRSSRTAWGGIAAGAIGLAIGIAVVIWRLIAWGALGA